jgi:hypothetical protein
VPALNASRGRGLLHHRPDASRKLRHPCASCRGRSCARWQAPYNAPARRE